MLIEHVGMLLAEAHEADVQRNLRKQALLREVKASQGGASGNGRGMRRLGALVAHMRRGVGGSLVTVGQWLQGAQSVGARSAHPASRLPGARLISTPAGAALVVDCDQMRRLQGRPAATVVHLSTYHFHG